MATKGSTKLSTYSQFNGGISDFPRLASLPNSYAFGRSIDVRSDPQNITVLPRTIKESGNVIVGLPKWLETTTQSNSLVSYIYDAIGTMYKRTQDGMYSNLFTVPSSHGNGLVYSAEDDYLYYTSDSLVGRYGPISSNSPTNVNDFFGSQGGVPLNTNSALFVAASSQYAGRADTTSLSIVSDLAVDMQIKPVTLPVVGQEMVLLSKWDESGAKRSYKFGILAISGYFGSGVDGTLTISADTTDSPIDSVCLGNAGDTTLTATNTSFAIGQQIFIHQSIGTNAGQGERNSIQGYTAGTITLATPLLGTYTTGAQVIVAKQYAMVTVNAGVVWTHKPWDGTVGGILVFLSNIGVQVNGIISSGGFFHGGGWSALKGGFRGGTVNGGEGEGVGGTGAWNSVNTANNGTGGGGSVGTTSGAGGGGYSTTGTTGLGTIPGSGGISYGSTDLTTAVFGGGGGRGAALQAQGGPSGGFVFISAPDVTVDTTTGMINVDGSDGQVGSPGGSGGGGGSGGSILIKCQTGDFGTNGLLARGGVKGDATGGGPTGGDGGPGADGRITVDYLTSVVGTGLPTITTIQDQSLVTNTSYQLQLALSANGTAIETLAQTANIVAGTWQQVGVSWKASTSTAIFYINALEIGTSVGTFTSIHDNTATFQLAMKRDGSGDPVDFYDGFMDEARLFNMTRSDGDMQNGVNQQIPVNTAGLAAYYQFNGDWTDSTSNTNTLTPVNGPTLPTDVPYPSPSTRLDIDQMPEPEPAGDTYAVPTTIDESSVDRLTFTPARDPQKSIQFTIDTVGTGDWTVTIHDVTNNVIATSFVPNANLHDGDYEFVYAKEWSPLTNFTNAYHAHITSTVADGTVVTGTSDDLETANYVTYFGFLLPDDAWHPMARFLNFWVVGNGRYVGTYNATLYNPNQIVLSANLRVRCFAYWREFLAIGTQQGENITDFEKGRIYFWDGIAPTFNTYIDVPEGGINAMYGSRGNLYVWAGYRNQLLVYQGGDSAVKLKDMPLISSTDFGEIYPQGVTMWQSLLRYASNVNSNSTTIQKGVYTWGSTNTKYPDILTFDYPLSTGTLSGSGVNVSLTAVVDTNLLIGWQNGLAFGIDIVDTTNPPFPTAQVRFMIEDADNVLKQKEGIEVTALFDSLTVGQGVALSYDLEGDGNFITNPDNTIVTDTFSRLVIQNGRFYESQIQMDIISSPTASPTIKGVEYQQDLLLGERIAG